MLKDFFRSKSTIFAIITDAYAIFGVASLAWNPYRILGFYWLDTCVMALFFLIFLLICKDLDVASAILTTAMLCVFMWMYLVIILYSTKELGIDKNSIDARELFYPYYDIVVFIVLSGLSHLHRLRKMLQLERQAMVAFNFWSLIGGMILVPLILLMSVWLNGFIRNINLSMILSLVILRNIIEFKKYRYMRTVELKGLEIKAPVEKE